MWYTGDDSNKRRIAYATSPDGISWSKGGKGHLAEDAGMNANLEFGAFAPTVWKVGDTYRMLFAGRKLVSGTTFQTKVLAASSRDGIAGPAPARAQPVRDEHQLRLLEPRLALRPRGPRCRDPFKSYYSGNTMDANGNGHNRIGLGESNNGANFSKFNGTTGRGKARCSTSDARARTSIRGGLGALGCGSCRADPKFVGFYWGTRGSDFKPRLGQRPPPTASRGPRSRARGTSGALLPLGNNAAFDNGGAAGPERPVRRAAPTTSTSPGSTALAFASIGFSSTAEDLGNQAATVTTRRGPIRRRRLLAGDNSGFDATAVGHPSVIKTAPTLRHVLHGTANGVSKIGRATAASPSGPFTRGAARRSTPAPSASFDATSVKDPVVFKDGCAPTGCSTPVSRRSRARGSSESATRPPSDGIIWTKRGVVLNPSQVPLRSDEVGVEPTGMLVDGSTLHVWSTGVDRTGRTRGDHATTSYPTPGAATAGIPNGWATYQLGRLTGPRRGTSVTSSGPRAERPSPLDGFLAALLAGGQRVLVGLLPRDLASNRKKRSTSCSQFEASAGRLACRRPARPRRWTRSRSPMRR